MDIIKRLNMMKYENRLGPGIVIVVILLIILGAHMAFADSDRSLEVTPYVDFNGTVHGGFGKHYDGLFAGMGFGVEVLLAMSDRLGVGVNVKTDAVYDVYTTADSKYTVIDEYGIWYASIGPIVYVGDMFYVTAMIQYNLDVFYENTYLHNGSDDRTIRKAPYNIDDMDWWFETGFRVDYHAAVYVAANTHLVETIDNTSRYQFHCGLKFFF